MVIALVLALVAPQEVPSVAAVLDAPELRAIGVAAQAWDDCLDAAAARYEPSGEPANAIATASLFDCQRESGELVEAQVRYFQSSLPALSPREARDKALETLDLTLRGREWRITRNIVNIRLAQRAR